MTWRVILGTVSLVLTTILLGFVAVTEPSRMEGFTRAYETRRIEVGATLFEGRCITCHGNQGQGIEGVAPALNAADLLVGTPLPPRLQEIGWAGTTADYIRSAIAGGRPRPSAAFANYPQRMPTWGEEYGGPLRKDQVDSLVAFIMNWAPQYAGAAAEPTKAIEGVGTDITIELPAGDATNGKTVAEGKGCAACHVTAAVGPAWLASADPNGEGVGARAEKRFTGADYTGKAGSAQQYLFESIVLPGAYLVPGASYVNATNGQSLMPAIYGGSLTKQEVADLIAYLESLK